MKYRYRPYPVGDPDSEQAELVWRPVISLRAFGERGVANLFGLVDTGADDTLLPESLIDSIGIVMASGDLGIIKGIDGKPILVRYGMVDLEVEDPRPPHRVFRWKARVGFHRRSIAILGHDGFLEHFVAMFHGRLREVSLLPHSAGLP